MSDLAGGGGYYFPLLDGDVNLGYAAGLYLVCKVCAEMLARLGNYLAGERIYYGS